eukprot:15844603-Heterocapsa_arctica.AAC.1
MYVSPPDITAASHAARPFTKRMYVCMYVCPLRVLRLPAAFSDDLAGLAQLSPSSAASAALDVPR